MALLEAAYRQELPESSKLLYADFLAEHPRTEYDNHFDAAFVLREVIREHRFFPSIAELDEALRASAHRAYAELQSDQWRKNFEERAALEPPRHVCPECGKEFEGQSYPHESVRNPTCRTCYLERKRGSDVPS